MAANRSRAVPKTDPRVFSGGFRDRAPDIPGIVSAHLGSFGLQRSPEGTAGGPPRTSRHDPGTEGLRHRDTRTRGRASNEHASGTVRGLEEP